MTMLGMLRVYSKLSAYNKETKEYDEIDGNYTLLDPVTDYWIGADKGLARFMDGDLSNHVDSITYSAVEGGFIEFIVKYKRPSDDTTIVEYNGERLALRKAVCKYIQGQISDGWGENGVYVVDFIGDNPIYCHCSWDLYEEVYNRPTYDEIMSCEADPFDKSRYEKRIIEDI